MKNKAKSNSAICILWISFKEITEKAIYVLYTFLSFIHFFCFGNWRWRIITNEILTSFNTYLYNLFCNNAGEIKIAFMRTQLETADVFFCFPWLVKWIEFAVIPWKPDTPLFRRPNTNVLYSVFIFFSPWFRFESLNYVVVCRFFFFIIIWKR